MMASTQHESGLPELAPEFPLVQDFKEEESLPLRVSPRDVGMRLLPAVLSPGEPGLPRGPFPGVSGGAKGRASPPRSRMVRCLSSHWGSQQAATLWQLTCGVC